jgi:hypothetical protein
MPVERAYLFFFNDDDEPKLHASAGLTRKFVPKPSYYAVSHLYQALGDYRYVRTVKNDKNLRIQEYANGRNPQKLVWVAWAPTEEGVEEKMIFTHLPGKIQRAERMPLQEKATPENSPIFQETGEDAAEVRVSGSPVYLFF